MGNVQGINGNHEEQFPPGIQMILPLILLENKLKILNMLMGGVDNKNWLSHANYTPVAQNRDYTYCYYMPNAAGAAGTTKPRPYDAEYKVELILMK